MIESNNPVPIGRDQIAAYKKAVEDVLCKYVYAGKTHALHQLILNADPEEDYVMTDTERDTYVTLREGMQVFKALAHEVSQKTGLAARLTKVAPSELSTDPELRKLRDFTFNYATLAGSLYIAKKLVQILKQKGVTDPKETRDLSQIGLETALPEDMVLKRLLAPVFAGLVQQDESKSFFQTPMELPVYVAGVFDRCVQLARQKKGAYPELEKNIEGYQFRIMDDFVVLVGFEDRSAVRIEAKAQQVSYRPMHPRDLVGNRNAKRKISRYMDRLALYDPIKQRNPVIELGGLSWSVLFDGPPGTGKSSLYRMAMTLLDERIAQVGLQRHFVTVDPSVKDEFYGKTGKILLERLTITQDPSALVLCIMDDIDLLTSTRDNAQGADNDVNSIIMQYLDGVFTERRGNVINFAASNKPTGLDDAMRNRFNDRLLIDGPQSAEDFADMVHLLGGKLLAKKLLVIDNGKDYTPFATQDIRSDKGGWSGASDVSAYMADALAKHKGATAIQFGAFMAELKAKNPKITGRSVTAIMESVKDRCANFDVPNEWFEKRAVFFEQSYERKVDMIAELHAKIMPDVLFQEAQRYFDSEERFARTEAESQTQKGYNSSLWNLQSEIRLYEDQIKKGDTSELSALEKLKVQLSAMDDKRKQTVLDALRRAG